MKKIIMLFLACFFAFSIVLVFAAKEKNVKDSTKKTIEWETQDWDKIQFKVLKGYTIKKEIDRFVSSDGKSLTTTILPVKGSYKTPMEIAKKVYENYKTATDKKIIAENELGLFNDFKLYYIHAQGTYNKKSIIFLIIALMHQKSPVNYYINSGWWDKPENTKYFEISKEIAGSIKLK